MGMGKAVPLALAILVAVLSSACGWLYVELIDRESRLKTLLTEVESLKSEVEFLKIENQRLARLLGNATQRSVPLYVGTSIHGFVDLARCLEVYNMIKNYTGLGNGTWIIMFGATRCPYCKAMDEFFSRSYPNTYKVLWVDVDQNAQKIFTRLAIAEICSDIVDIAYSVSVPQTVVLKDSSVHAIVVGMVTDAVFWNQIVGR